MKALITRIEGNKEIVIGISKTNLKSQKDAAVISVGTLGVRIVPDDDANEVGREFTNKKKWFT